MKLIDLLVRELPKRGGWPDCCASISQDDDGCLCIWKENGARCCDGFWVHQSGFGLLQYWNGKFAIAKSEDRMMSIITKSQYEAALAASNPQWDGEGLPPVGCECEVKVGGDYFNLCRVVYSDKSCGVAFIYLGGDDEKYCGQIDCVSAKASPDYFRPVRSEADKKRDEAGLAFYHAINWNAEGELVSPARMEDYKKAYDAIAAGKIPGVKLEG